MEIQSVVECPTRQIPELLSSVGMFISLRLCSGFFGALDASALRPWSSRGNVYGPGLRG